MVPTNSLDHKRERERLLVVVVTIVINVVAVSLLTFAAWSDWRTGAALNIVDNCLLVGFTVVRHDALLARFLLFGVVVGLTELPAVETAQAASVFVIESLSWCTDAPNAWFATV